MKISIIDSGVDVNHKKVTPTSLVKQLWFKNNNTLIEEKLCDELGHGTACCAIINKHISAAEIYSLRIYNGNLQADSNSLVRAIKWSIENKMEIINISSGISDFDGIDQLRECCQEAFEKNIPIVAATNNDPDTPTFPALFQSVFGVTAGSYKTATKFRFIKDSSVDIIAKGGVQRVAWTNGMNNIVQGTSYACAHFTGIVAGLLNDYHPKSISELKKILVEKSDNQLKPIVKSKATFHNSDLRDINKSLDDVFNLKKKLSWIKKLGIYPLSEKEIGSLFKFQNLGPYKIAEVYDFPRHFTKSQGRTSSKFINNETMDSFDTFCVGYFYDNLFESNIRYGVDLITKAIKLKKNLFLLDDRLLEVINTLGLDTEELKVYIPSVGNSDFKKVLTFRNLKRVNTPVLAVVGTSNKQGKFTTQLTIKRILEKFEYKVSHISTEPQSELCGSDAIFPYGNGRDVKLDKSKWGVYLHCLLKGIQEYHKPDIIISGTQGWTVPLGYSYEPFGNETNSSEFLYGLQPDGVICCFNPDDKIDVIKKVLNACNVFCDARPVFYCMTPISRQFLKIGDQTLQENKVLSEKEYMERIKFYEKELDLPVLNIMDDNNEKIIVDQITKFFS